MLSDRDKVLRYLAVNIINGRPWTPVWKIACPQVGGLQGDRRMRELRAKGWPIIKKRIENSSAYEYRLDITKENAMFIVKSYDWHKKRPELTDLKEIS